MILHNAAKKDMENIRPIIEELRDTLNSNEKPNK
jgi:hypothetical protein